jgi:hypothetical protein
MRSKYLSIISGKSLLEEAGAMPYVEVPNEMYVCLFLGAAVLE